ncbi:MAG: nucleoside triphosphate pyrophosphohydrolase [Acidobacteria bacterium]|nr:nucleoside triphosphate pyrophosphohydrolase [Acidobacteriota bacterium]
MQRLRAPNGCPWDREQTFESLRPFVLEEAYEIVGAIDRGDRAELVKEIGDLIFEGVFLAQLLSEEHRGTVADALGAVIDKLVRRHPHVFGKRAGRPTVRSKRMRKSPAEVLTQWEEIKARERQETGAQRSILAGMPRDLPALLRAHQIGTRAAAVGFDWARAEDVIEKIEEEVAELRGATRAEGQARVEEEMGDLLFAIANLSRKLGIEPESALRNANEKFARRFERLESRLHERGTSVHAASLEVMETAWREINRDE